MQRSNDYDDTDTLTAHLVGCGSHPNTEQRYNKLDGITETHLALAGVDLTWFDAGIAQAQEETRQGSPCCLAAPRSVHTEYAECKSFQGRLSKRKKDESSERSFGNYKRTSAD